MEGVGPADRLPLFIAMVQQAASEKASVPPLQGRVAADPDFGLVPDLIAAADFLSPPATSPSSAPAVLAHRDLGGLLSQSSRSFFLLERLGAGRRYGAVTATNWIRASTTIVERPPLPTPPAHHPSTRWWNHYDPEAPVDTEVVRVELPALSAELGAAGKLKALVLCMSQVNKWKAANSDLSFNSFYG
ncbi:uncharacterized protein PITG_10155 [Phytophthora infestans T30-4]|uniref:Uncharacterized protein n=1 Tax=Phytophthora infestans (strain T30-4) TaxID=403677 RepID=D0NEG2_PHYIT|nr:uncharacterized protein PITG_10155 [Phytophthora infestans T30-4]EEY56607.1 hypothetical protein PITG_10155 [Phytophthora infestans T30-4]|eukprot:XP_002902681.1 hypothetical protein PITG_10155 [Phytophthora infestans T30-4]